MRIRDPGWKKFGSGIRDAGWKKVGSGIRDKHLGFATLKDTFFYILTTHQYMPSFKDAL